MSFSHLIKEFENKVLGSKRDSTTPSRGTRGGRRLVCGRSTGAANLCIAHSPVRSLAFRSFLLFVGGYPSSPGLLGSTFAREW
jgi:hypothetical protein